MLFMIAADSAESGLTQTKYAVGSLHKEGYITV
jgi:hypothetical protein